MIRFGLKHFCFIWFSLGILIKVNPASAIIQWTAKPRPVAPSTDPVTSSVPRNLRPAAPPRPPQPTNVRPIPTLGPGSRTSVSMTTRSTTTTQLPETPEVELPWSTYLPPDAETTTEILFKSNPWGTIDYSAVPLLEEERDIPSESSEVFSVGSDADSFRKDAGTVSNDKGEFTETLPDEGNPVVEASLPDIPGKEFKKDLNVEPDTSSVSLDTPTRYLDTSTVYGVASTTHADTHTKSTMTSSAYSELPVDTTSPRVTLSNGGSVAKQTNLGTDKSTTTSYSRTAISSTTSSTRRTSSTSSTATTTDTTLRSTRAKPEPLHPDPSGTPPQDSTASTTPAVAPTSESSHTDTPRRTPHSTPPTTPDSHAHLATDTTLKTPRISPATSASTPVTTGTPPSSHSSTLSAPSTTRPSAPPTLASSTKPQDSSSQSAKPRQTSSDTTTTRPTTPTSLGGQCQQDPSACAKAIEGSECVNNTCVCTWDRYHSPSGNCSTYTRDDRQVPTVIQRSSRNVSLSWPSSKSYPDARVSYNVTWSALDGGDVRDRLVDTSDVTIVDLRPGTWYKVTVTLVLKPDRGAGRVLMFDMQAVVTNTAPPDVGPMTSPVPLPDSTIVTFAAPDGNFSYCSANITEIDVFHRTVCHKANNHKFNCTHLQLDHVKPAMNYNMTISALLLGSHNLESSRPVGYQVSTRCQDPGPVRNLTSASVTSNSVTMTWLPPAQGHTTTYQLKVDATLTTCLDTSGNVLSCNKDKSVLELDDRVTCDTIQEHVTRLSYTIGSLNTASTYAIELVPYSDSCTGASSHLNITTSSAVPGTPQNLKVVMTVTQMFISWTPPVPYPGPTNYVITLVSLVRNETVKRRYNVTGYNSTRREINHLEPYTVYNMSILAYTAAGRSSPSTPGSYRTLPAKSDPVESLTVTQRTSQSLVLTWTSPVLIRGALQAYVIFVRGARDTACQAMYVLTSSANLSQSLLDQSVCGQPTNPDIRTIAALDPTMTFNLTGLKPCETYTVTVAPVNDVGLGVVKYVSESTTASVPRIPEGLTCEAVTQGTLTLTWTSLTPQPCPVVYQVTVYQSQTFDNVMQTFDHVINETISDINSGSILFKNLKTFWQYKIDISAISAAGNSSVLSLPLIRTLPSAPGPVSVLQVRSFQQNQVSVVWNCPADDQKNGEISNFLLIMKPKKILRQDKSVDFIKTSNMTVPAQQQQPNSCSTRNSFCSCLRPYNLTITVTPQILYVFQIRAKVDGVDQYGPPVSTSFELLARAPAEIVQLPVQRPNKDEHSLNDTSFTVSVCTSCLLDNSHGEILAFGILVCQLEFCEDDDQDKFRTWPGSYLSMSTWKRAKDNHFELTYRVTDKSWEQNVRNLSQSGVDDVMLEIGNDSSCNRKSEKEFCNGPLPSGASFRLRLFSCTVAGCSVSKYAGPFSTSASKTEKSSDLIVIGGAGAGIAVAITVLTIVIVVRLRLKLSKSSRTKKGSELSQVIALKEMDSCKDDGKSKPIKIRDFDETLLKLHADGNALLNLEYQELDKLSPLYPMDVGSDLDHRADNRWTNIVPFDHSRVKLYAREGSGQHDYINANYIAGMDSSREYIATQGPLTKTIPEFWRMVWEQKSSAIVMLSEFEAIDKRTQMMREKVARYYPDEEESSSYQYDQIMVSRTGKLDTKDWEIRTLKLTHLTERKNRFVKHFFFKYWSDHEANINPVDLIDFVRVVRAETSAQPTSPLIVHCSAGVGRTGTYIAVDYFNKYIQSLKLKLEKTDKRMQENWTVDIFGRVLNMRDKRRFMVQSKAQYIFIYDVVQELLRQAFKPNHPGTTTHVRRENDDASFTDAGSNASGPAKEDAVYDDVESLQGQITSSEEMLIRISTGSSDV